LLIALLVLMSVQGFAGESAPPKDSQQAYQQLLSVRCFAFGGFGFAGIKSQGELCFRMVASSTNALPLFRATLQHGTTEAQLYALCGIRHLAPGACDTAAAPVITANKKVTEMIGCELISEHASNTVVRIKSGSYESYLASEKDKQ
jgi:hypothetical protein